MRIWYCEKCGHRISDDDLPKAVNDPKTDGYFCQKCALSPASAQEPVAVVASVPRSAPVTAYARKTNPPAARRGTATPASPSAPTPERAKSRTPIYLGLAAGVSLLAVVIVVATRGKPAPPEQNVAAAAPAINPERTAWPPPTPGQSPRSNSAENRSAPDNVAKPTQRILAPADDAEARAAAAFEALQKAVKDLPDDAGKAAAIEDYLRLHGAAITSRRAAVWLEKLKAPPLPAPTPQTARRDPVSQPAVEPQPAPEPQDTVRACLERGLQKERAGDVAAALAEYERAIKLDPKDALGWSNRGNMRISQVDLLGGLADADKTIELNATLWQPYALRVIALYGLGRETESAAALEQLKKIHPNFTQIAPIISSAMKHARSQHISRQLEGKQLTAASELILRGTARLSAGRDAEGKADLEAALKADPALATAVFTALSNYAAGKKDWKGKLNHVIRWLEFAPKSPEAMNGLAWELLTSPDASLHDFNAAVKLARRAVELSRRENPAILDTYALALARTGKLKQAVEAQESALGLLPAGTPPESRKGYEQRLAEFKAALQAK